MNPASDDARQSGGQVRARARVAAAHQRTISASTSRIEVLTEVILPPRTSRERRRRGGLLRPAISLSSAVSRSLLARFAQNFGHLRAQGVLDLQHRRYMLDHGGYARLGTDGTEQAGPPGTVIKTCSAEEPNPPTPLWLIDVLTGLIDATAVGTDTVRGTPCTRLQATVDLSQASRINPGAVAVPALNTFEDALALPIEVWTDHQHLRRVRFSQDIRTDTLELWDIGTPLGDLDWTRLQAFPFSPAS
jgi:hypothetical protein